MKEENDFLKQEIERLSRLIALKGMENFRNQKRARDLIKQLSERAAALEEQKTQLEKQKETLEKTNELMIGRELKMVEMKEKIRELENRAKG